jgi:hypothetical protein
MAGVKGRSGGARPGAGRKPKAKAPAANQTPQTPGVKVTQEPQAHGGSLKRAKAKQPDQTSALNDGKTRDPLTFLELVINDPQAPLKDRIRAAVAAAQYRHTKRHDGGKKEDTAGKAKEAATGRFSAPAVPPRLAAAGGRRLT